MLERWLESCPELELVPLDVAAGKPASSLPEQLGPPAKLLASPEEKLLVECLDQLAAGNHPAALAAALRTPTAAASMPDLYLLQGALLLAEARSVEAVEPLGKAYALTLEEADNSAGPNGHKPEPLGAPARRLFPALRILLRVGPTQLLPLYPDSYGAALLYAVALWRTARSGEALEVLREAVQRSGLNDEIRLLAGQLCLQRGELDKALATLAEGADVQRDALDFSRTLYLSLARQRAGDLRGALRELRTALLHTGEANRHTVARARIELAGLYAEAGLPLEALRHSGAVEPAVLPSQVAAWLAGQEAQWVRQVEAYSEIEVEQMARADPVSLHIPAPDDVLKLEPRKLDIRRDPLAELKPTELSWARRREQEQQIEQIRESIARGESIAIGEPHFSPEAREFLGAVRRMLHWWEQRQRELKLSGPDTLLRDPGKTAHVRFDFNGTRGAPAYSLPCERRLAQLAWAGGVALALLVLLVLVRACAGA